MKTSKRLFALLLTVCMVLVMIPAASAAKDDATGTFTYDFDALKIANANNITFSGTTTYLTNAGTVLAEMKAQKLINWQFKSTTIATASYATFSANGYVYGRASNLNYIAFEIDNPGQGTYELSVNHAVSGNGAAGVGVYILPGGTADITSALAADTCMGTYNCYLSGEKTNYSTTNITSSNLTGTWEVKDDNNYIVVFRADQSNTSGSARMYLSQLVLTPVVNSTEVSTGDELKSALSAAESDSTVVLSNDVTVEEALAVPAGVTLDLNGKTLTATSVAADFDGANIVDSSASADGFLKVAADKLSLQSTNTQLPLYDTANGGYKFYTATLKTWEPEGNDYWFRLTFSDSSAYDLISTGTSGLKLGVDMSWTVDGAAGGTTAYLEENSTIYTGWATAVSNSANAAIKVTVTGTDKVDTSSFKLVPVYTSSAIAVL